MSRNCREFPSTRAQFCRAVNPCRASQRLTCQPSGARLLTGILDWSRSMAGRLRRATLTPITSGSSARVGELAEMSINGFKRAEQSSNDDSAAQDLMCKKGFAVSARSRGYDHKDAFEPAQGATAPPSDADEFGAWLKYEGSAPVPAAQAKAISEEELPTSWFKYETKAIASLTAAELRRAKDFQRLNETTDPLKLPALQAETVIGGAVVVAESAEPGDPTSQDSLAEPSVEAHGPAEHEPEPTTAAAVFAPS